MRSRREMLQAAESQSQPRSLVDPDSGTNSGGFEPTAHPGVPARTMPEPDQHWWQDGLGDWHVEILHRVPWITGAWMPLTPPREAMTTGKLWITRKYIGHAEPFDLEAR